MPYMKRKDYQYWVNITEDKLLELSAHIEKFWNDDTFLHLGFVKFKGTKPKIALMYRENNRDKILATRIKNIENKVKDLIYELKTKGFIKL